MALDFVELDSEQARIVSELQTAERTEREYARRSNLAGAVKRHVDGGKRSMDVVVSIRGIEIARKTLLYTRGKVSSVSYLLPALDWADPQLQP